MRSRRGSEAIDFQDIAPANVVLPPDLDRTTALKRFHVRDRNGVLRSGAAGFIAMWRELPALRWLANIARLPGVTALLEVLYRGFLRIRPAIQRLVGAWDRRVAGR